MSINRKVLTASAIIRARKLLAENRRRTRSDKTPLDAIINAAILAMPTSVISKFRAAVRRQRIYRHGKPADHSRPWVKYANRPRLGRPSDFTHAMPLTGTMARTIARLFGRYMPLFGQQSRQGSK